MRKDTNCNAEFYQRVTINLFRCIQIPVKHFNVELYAKIAAFSRYFFTTKSSILDVWQGSGYRILSFIFTILGYDYSSSKFKDTINSF